MAYTNSIIGTSFDDYIQSQLNLRAVTIRDKASDPQWQKLYTSKTAWVKLSSSVNIEGSSEKASKNILAGRGIEGTSNINKGYNDSPTLGTRPIPGITNVSIQAINRFGTLRNAVVEFKVYDVERLDELEQLYMRPGFSVLLEWGHTVYKTSSSGVVTSPSPIQGFFEEEVQAKKVEEEIRAKKKASEGNYDAIFGYIKNFQWSYNMDGSYNCRVDIISKGELLESIEFAVYSKAPQNEESAEVNVEKRKSPLHDLLYSIKELEIYGAGDTQLLPYLDITELQDKKGFKFSDVQHLTDSLKVYGPVKTEKESDENGQYMYFITVGALLETLNKFTLLRDKNNEPISKFRTDVISNFVTHPYHISGDPGIAMTAKGVPDATFGGNRESVYSYGSLAARLDRRTEESLFLIIPENINEQWLNLDFVIQELDNVIDPSSGKGDLFSALSGILAGMEGAFGGINEFDIAFNEDENYHYVVDRRYSGNKRNLYKLVVSGKSSIFSNISITSKLSPALGTLVAISAQNSVSPSDVGVEAENLFKWNTGLRDRVIPDRLLAEVEKITPRQQTPTSEQQFLAQRQQGLQDALAASKSKYDQAVLDRGELLQNFRLYDTYSKEAFAAIQSAHRLVTQQELSRYLTDKGRKAAPGIIPFELSMTLDGIGGFKIGQVFEIVDPNIFPAKYRGEIAFIITGLEHTIENNRWTTTLKAQTVTK